MTPAECVSEILHSLVEKAKVGVNFLELEKSAEIAMRVMDCQSANLNYKPEWAKTPFPSVLCLGVNDVVAHPIPNDYTLQDGDLLHIDCGIVKDGMCGDAGLTIPIGKISNQDERLLRYAKRALYVGIKEVKPGIKVTKIGEAIEKYARQMGFVVNKVFHGHGIGRTMHEGVQIPHFSIPKEEKKIGGHKYQYKEPDNIPTLFEGQVICIEPHLTYRDEFGFTDSDGWTTKTKDGRKSCFFEHMIRVVSGGYEILTTHVKEVNDGA